MARTSVTRIRILEDGVEVVDGAESLNFTGSGVIVSATGAAVDVAITGGAGSFSILTATGTIDDSNMDFVFAQRPKIIVMNGIQYKDGDTSGGVLSWSWNAGTNTATMFSPPGVGNSIFGITY